MAQELEYFILGGSLEIHASSGYITCAVFQGTHEWDIKGNKTIKYVSFDGLNAPKGQTILQSAIETYKCKN